MVGFIYILDNSNSSSFAFWSSKFTSSSTCDKIGSSNGNSNHHLRYNFAVVTQKR